MNDFQIKIVCFINNQNNRELRFNYYDREGNQVGYIFVDELGNMSWQILNLMYKDSLLNIISYIYMADAHNLISHSDKESNGMRWIRARMYIQNNKMPINYSNELMDYVQEEKTILR